MEQIIKNVDSQHVYTTLIEYGDVVLKQNPTLSVGDVKISLDNGSFVDITTLPTVIGGYKIDIQLSQSETNCSQLQIIFKDQTAIPEWNDKVLNISTSQLDYNNITSISANNMVTPQQIINYMDTSSAKLDVAVSTRSTFNPLTQGVSAINDFVVDLSPVINRLDDASYGLSAINYNVLSTSALVSNIPTNNNGIVVSANNMITPQQIINYMDTSSAKLDVAVSTRSTFNPLTQSVSAINIQDVDLTPITTRLDNTSYGLSAINHNILITSSAPVDFSPITSAINYIISDLDNANYGLSAINANVTVTNANVIATSAIANEINAVTSQITMSGGNINARVADKGILNDISVTDILGSDVDGMSMNDALTKILSWAIGKIDVNGSVFTYYKQDNSTSAFALSGSDVNRSRV